MWTLARGLLSVADPLERETLRGLPALAPFLVSPGRLQAARRPAPTGIPPLDALLGGGFPRGQIAELVGPRSSGRTRVLLQTLAHATASGALGAFVDVADGLDPASANACGVRLSQLLWIRCGGRVETGLRAADVVIRGGGFDVVVVDLGDPTPGTLARVPAAAFVRLQRGVEATPAALVLAGPRRVAGSLAAVAVALTRRGVEWARGGPGLLAGLIVEAHLARSRARAPGATARLVWTVLPGASAPEWVRGEECRRLSPL